MGEITHIRGRGVRQYQIFLPSPALDSKLPSAGAAGVEMPIVNATYDVLFNGLSPKEACKTLMTRDLKFED